MMSNLALRLGMTGAVIGLQCRLCIPFAYEEKVGPKRKPSTTFQ
jgi:hypothetical protein